MLCHSQIKLITDCVRSHKYTRPAAGVGVSAEYFKTD